MSVFRLPLDTPPSPRQGHNPGREADTIRAVGELRMVVDRVVTFLAPYSPDSIVDATGRRKGVLAIEQGVEDIGPRLHNVTGISAGLTDPFSIAGSVIDAVLGSITPPSPATFVSTLSGLFTTALGTVSGAGSPPSRATVKTLVDGYLGSLSGLIGDVGAAVTAELDSRASGLDTILENHFSTPGALQPRNGDYIYSEATGIVYVLFNQKGGVPSSNSIFRVPFSVGSTTWVALTTFPAPDLAGFVGSVTSMALGMLNSLMSLLANLLTDTIMALFGLITAIWGLIDDMIELALDAVWDAIGLLEALLAAIQELLENPAEVNVVSSSGVEATLLLLGYSYTENNFKKRINYIQSDDGYGAEAEVAVFGNITTPIVDQVDWREIDYISQNGTRRKTKALTRIVSVS